MGCLSLHCHSKQCYQCSIWNLMCLAHGLNSSSMLIEMRTLNIKNKSFLWKKNNKWSSYFENELINAGPLSRDTPRYHYNLWTSQLTTDFNSPSVVRYLWTIQIPARLIHLGHKLKYTNKKYNLWNVKNNFLTCRIKSQTKNTKYDKQVLHN